MHDDNSLVNMSLISDNCLYTFVYYIIMFAIIMALPFLVGMDTRKILEVLFEFFSSASRKAAELF